MGHDTRIAVDVAKAVFEVAISDRPGHVARHERLQRAEFLPFMAQQPSSTVPKRSAVWSGSRLAGSV